MREEEVATAQPRPEALDASASDELGQSRIYDLTVRPQRR